MAAGKDDDRLFCLGKNEFLYKQRIRFGAVELFHHLACPADFAHFDQASRFKRQDMMTHPRGRLLQGPCEMRKRCRGIHQQAKDIHTTGIRQELDLVKGIDRFYFFHFD